MSKKKYPNLENEPSQAKVDEPMAAYGTGVNDLPAAHIESDWWNLISEEERQHINKGLEDIEAGRTISHAEMRKSYEQWL